MLKCLHFMYTHYACASLEELSHSLKTSGVSQFNSHEDFFVVSLSEQSTETYTMESK